MYAYRIEVGLKREISLAAKLRGLLGDWIRDVESAKVYTLSGLESSRGADRLLEISRGALFDPVIESASVEKSLALTRGLKFDYAIEIALLPGVTDPVGKTAAAQLEPVLKEPVEVFTSTIFFLNLDQPSPNRISELCRVLGNPLIEEFRMLSYRDYLSSGGFEKRLPVSSGDHQPAIRSIDLSALNDRQLAGLSQERCLGMNLEELRAVRDFFSRSEIIDRRKESGLDVSVTDCELEILAQTWSEHCKHKEFSALIDYTDLDTGEKLRIDGLFKTYIRASTMVIKERLAQAGNDWLLSIFSDNAGITRFNDQYSFSWKCETHNAPSALEPYGGAITGILGNNRDIMGAGLAGGEVWFNTFCYCLGDPVTEGDRLPDTLSSRYLHDHVVAGVKDGGNKSGIPTLAGGLVFDERYRAKPLVYCGSGGLIPLEVGGRPGQEKVVRPGDLAVVAGGRTGKDGIHGATMSSEERHKDSPVTAVQIGDPITQKVMFDFLREAGKRGYIQAIQDFGAGGASSCFGEMAAYSNGAVIELEKFPLKYPGLDPWEIMLSESQERMGLIIAPENWENFRELAMERSVEATVVGSFTDSGVFEVRYQGKAVACLPLEFLHEGTPRKRMEAHWSRKVNPEPELPRLKDPWPAIERVMGMPDLCSREWIFRQYDDGVKGGTVMKTLAGGEIPVEGKAGVLTRIGQAGFEAMATSQGICPRYGEIDGYSMGMAAFDRAVGRLAAVGARLPEINGDDRNYWSVCDNFCVPDSAYHPDNNPDGKFKLAQLVRINQALFDYSVYMNTPLTSGKDSMKNDFVYHDQQGRRRKISIPPTILISAAARIEDYRKCQTSDFKGEGDMICLIGETRPELGGSQYYRSFPEDCLGNREPKLDLASSKRLYRLMAELIDHEFLSSSAYIEGGGLAAALVKGALSGGVGFAVDLSRVNQSQETHELLFSESLSRFLVTVPPERLKEFKEFLSSAHCRMIGTVTSEELKLTDCRGNDYYGCRQSLIRAYQDRFRFDLPRQS
ncbi:MAG: AIR synthase-related protein [bacterium]